MYFVLVIAILSTLLWLNTMFTEHINAKINVYTTNEDSDEDKQRAKLKLVLIVIMALFWGAVICYF